MTFDRYVSNPDIGRTFWGGLTPSNQHKSKMATGHRYGCTRASFVVSVSKVWYSGVASWNMIILTCSRSKSGDKGHTKVNTAGNITISCNIPRYVFFSG